MAAQNRLVYTLRLADDALILGQRTAEWCSRGPFLEEDIALSNVALDLIGRARLLYTYAAEQQGEGYTEDDYAYLRGAPDFQNCLMFELPRGDFAFSIVRQWFVDIYENRFFEQLQQSEDSTLAAIAEKTIKECRYHLRRSRQWVIRLGDGTEESHQRVIDALNTLWPYTAELFELDSTEQDLLTENIAVARDALKQDWLVEVRTTLNEATLSLPDTAEQHTGGRTGQHTEHLAPLLEEMQSLHRAHPGVTW
ncbi:MAG: 1,2-phenylacetyl-CoA epoxidase subunit PaaC [Pseudomonadota bacterium]